MDLKVILIIVVIAVAAAYYLFTPKNPLITGEELLKQMQDKKPMALIDVRTPEEFASGHIEGAVNVPLAGLEKDIVKAVPDKKSYVVVYCRSGRRSANASSALIKMGYTNLVNYKGSMIDWTNKGYKTVK